LDMANLLAQSDDNGCASYNIDDCKKYHASR